ncbi:MAG: YceD family protein [Gaiellaceae bacterium]
MTTFDLRRLKLRSGDQFRDDVEVVLEPLLLGGQEYRPEPDSPTATLTITKAITGTVFNLGYRAALHGPCFRCLEDAVLELPVRAREYQANDPAGDEELRSPYVAADTLDLTSWARDALALALPDKILCRPDCAGLCPVCGVDRNVAPHTHDELAADSRWAALDELRGRL